MLLQVSGLTAGYDGRAVLRGIDLALEAGQRACVIGANGAGKTTLLRTLAGLQPPLSGSLRLDGQEMARAAPARRVARGLVLVPEGRRVFAPLTVAENLEMGAYRRLWPRRDPTVGRDRDMVFHLFPRLRERLTQFAGSLSGGEQQMLAIGRGLMSAPRVLMLDEPSMGLAPIVMQEIAAALRTLGQQGIAVLLTEQKAHLALDFAEAANVLADGVIAMSGPSSVLRHDPAVQAAYLGA
jgi:branched-chain amino acid transport system ATP-binding protein